MTLEEIVEAVADLEKSHDCKFYVEQHGDCLISICAHDLVSSKFSRYPQRLQSEKFLLATNSYLDLKGALMAADVNLGQKMQEYYHGV